MQIVNVFDTDGDHHRLEHAMTLLVHHNVHGRSIKQEWGEALDVIRESHPEDWHVEQVFDRLEKAGWQVIRVDDAVEVTY